MDTDNNCVSHDTVDTLSIIIWSMLYLNTLLTT